MANVSSAMVSKPNYTRVNIKQFHCLNFVLNHKMVIELQQVLYHLA